MTKNCQKKQIIKRKNYYFLKLLSKLLIKKHAAKIYPVVI